MDRDDMEGILGKAIAPVPSSKGLNQAKPTTPPQNPIIPKKKAAEWDETFTRLEQKLDGLIVDGDAHASRLEAGLATQLLMEAKIASLTRQILWRDIAIILMLVILGIIVGFNTMRLWGWE